MSFYQPSLSTAEQKHRSKSSRMSLWGGHSHDISGYGRPLTFNEIKTIFRWLRSISVDFLYNNGQGPPLKELHNHYYENLQIILKYYDKNVHSLKKKVEKLMAQLDDQVKKLGKDYSPKRYVTVLQRQKTIMGNSSSKKRMELENQVKIEQNTPYEKTTELLDIVLRILIAKGEGKYVRACQATRKKKEHELETKRKVNAAIKGKRLSK